MSDIKEELLIDKIYEKEDYCEAACGNLHKKAFEYSYSSYYRNKGYSVFVCSEKCAELFKRTKKCEDCGVGTSGCLKIHKGKAYCTDRLGEYSCYARLMGLKSHYCSSCNQEEREEDIIETGYTIGNFKFCKTCFESAKFELDFNAQVKSLFDS